jgi:hypothetical protein
MLNERRPPWIPDPKRRLIITLVILHVLEPKNFTLRTCSKSRIP